MKKLLLAILFTSLLLTSCASKGLPVNKRIPLLTNENYVKPADKSYDELEYSDYTEKVNLENVINKINNKDSFVIYFYSKTCHFCGEVKPLFLKYIFETKYIFNTLEVNGDGDPAIDIVNTLSGFFPEYFDTESFGVPYFYFFLEGEVVAKKGLTSKERQDYRLFKDFLNSYVKPAN